MKWIKRLLLFVAVLLIGAVLLSAGGYYMLRGTPSWYHASALTDDQRKAAAQRVEDMLGDVHQRLALAHARRSAASSLPATTAMAVAQPQDEPFELTFTDDELNAVYNKWINFNNRRALVDRYVEDPRLVIQDDRMVIAGTVKELNTIITMELTPKIDDQGRLVLSLDKVAGGFLPLPDAVWSRQAEKMTRMLQRNLPGYQAAASLQPDGVANGSAASAAMDELLLGVLHHESTEPVIFIPIDFLNLSKTLPLKITAVSIQDHTLKMTAMQMSGPERDAMLDRLRAPNGDATAEIR